MTTTYTFPPSQSTGGADGANRQYQLSAASVPDSVVQQVVFEGDAPSDVAVFNLAAATVGDELTVFIESAPAVTASTLALVIPAAFDDGSIRVINRSGINFFLATEASLGSPLQPSAGSAPGVSQVRPGTTEFLIVSTLTADGNKLVQVNSLRALVKTTSAREFVFNAPAVGASTDFLFPFPDYALWLLEYQWPRSFRLYSDQPVDCHVEMFVWDESTRGFTNMLAEATWTNQASGEPDYATLNIMADLSKYSAGNGTYSMMLPNCVVRLTLTGFSGGAPTFVRAAIGVKTLVTDFA